MAKFAILIGNQVTTCIIADDKETAIGVSPNGSDIVEYTDDNPAAVGYTYDHVTGKFIAPISIEEVPNA